MVSCLTGLLRTFWLAGILPITIASIPSSRLNSFRGGLLRGFNKKENSLQSSSSKFTIPQRFLYHFYAYALVWTTLLLSTTWIYAYKMVTPSVSGLPSHEHHRRTVLRSLFLLLLMDIQAFRRLIETIYVVKYRPSARMHISIYIASLCYYTAAPLSLCCTLAPDVLRFTADQLSEFLVRGKSDQMQVFESDWWGFVNPFMKLTWYQWIGAALFLWGSLHQIHCHAILGSLRKNVEDTDKYAIPYGDWFEMVSSPHYLAEIVIYSGLLVASGGSDLTIWLLLGSVVGNLVLTAAETHKWYLRKFDNYPKNRFAIFPYVY